MDTTNNRPINILSIDGGSNGLPALCILEEMFSRLKYDLKSEEELRPCDYFDAIGGTGTGALVVLLLGRLKMTSTQAIEAYIKLVPALSLPSTKDEEQQKKNSAVFEDAFRELLSTGNLNADIPLLDESGPKTVVFTLNTVSMSAPHILRSYRTRSSKPPSFTVLQAACASVASQDKFSPVTVGEGHRRVTLVDATTGYANPTSELLREAKEAFGGEIKVAMILSLGTATKVVRMDMMGSSRSPEKVVLQQILENCERVHNEVHRRLGEGAIYYRLTVDVDLELPPNEVSGIVSSYLQQEATSSALDLAIRTAQSRVGRPTLNEINSIAPIEITLKPRPSLVRDFVGREDILQAMRQTHFNHHTGDRSCPAISVLTGLGGSGKTQTALKFAFEYENRYPDASVYFVDGSRETTLKTDLETVIRSQGSNHRLASYEDALIWLATKSKKWLLVIDNVDDPSVKLSSFIPRCSHGHIIITTRDSTRSTLAPNSTHVIEGLSAGDAVTLLLKSSNHELNPSNQVYAKAIVEELGHLPLALAHAAAYISIHQCLSTYLSIYRQSRTNLLATSLDLSHGYSRSVAATIQMSLDRLPSSARDLLRIFAHLDARSIAYTVIAKAAERTFRHVQWTKEDDLRSETVAQASILMKIFCPSQEWVPTAFDEVISTCLRYSLLRVATQNKERFYSMHVLVQSYLQEKSVSIDEHPFPGLVVRLLGSAILTSSHYYDHFAFNRLLFPHIRLVDLENVAEPGDHYAFGTVLEEMSDEIMAIAHLERCVRRWKQSKGEDDWNTLAAMTVLGSCYKDVGREEQALQIREQTMGIYRRVWSDNHPGTIMSMSNLAYSYSAAGREQEALELRETVLEKRRKLLGDDNRYTIDAMLGLAHSYAAVGRDREALYLKEAVLEKRRELLGDEHQDTLRAMDSLAYSYSIMGRDQEALELGEVVVEKYKRLLGNEHKNTLSAMNDLAKAYSALGRGQEALEMMEIVLKKYKGRRHDEHRDILEIKSDLATSYCLVGRDQEALELREIVVEKYRRLLGDANRDTLLAMHNLSNSYSAIGREKEALGLREIVLEKRRGLLGDEHRDTLLAMDNLACSYLAIGRDQEALEMQRLVLSKFTAKFGGEHADALRAMRNLAHTYRKLGMITELEELLLTALPLHVKVFDHEHTKRIQEDDMWVRSRIGGAGFNMEVTVDDANSALEMWSNRKRKRASQSSQSSKRRK